MPPLYELLNTQKDYIIITLPMSFSLLPLRHAIVRGVWMSPLAYWPLITIRRGACPAID